MLTALGARPRGLRTWAIVTMLGSLLPSPVWVTSETLTTSITTTNTIDPSQAIITNVGFTDTSGSGYWIDGTVTWVAPNNPAFEYFRIVMSATNTGADGAVMVDNINSAVRSYEIVNSDARGIVRGTNTGGIWANYIVVQAYRSGAFSPANEAGSLMLTDISNIDAAAVSVGTFGGDWAGLALVDSIAFTDSNPAENLLTGTVTWTFGATTDYGFASDWRVYIADDTQGTNRQLLGTVAKDLTQLSITDEACDPTHVYVLVYANNEHGESPNASSVSFWDDGRPTSTTVTVTSTSVDWPGCKSVTFTDTDTDANQLGGVINWVLPDDASRFSHWTVYMATTADNSNRQALQDSVEGFNIPVGQTSLTLQTNQVRQTTDASPANFIVVLGYRTDLGAYQNPAVGCATALYDDSGAAPVVAPFITALSFTDEDPSWEYANGTVSWTQDSLTADQASVSHYKVFLAEDLNGTNQLLVNTVSRDSSSASVASTMIGYRNHVLVYASNKYGDSPTSVGLEYQGKSPLTTSTATSTSTFTATTSSTTSQTETGTVTITTTLFTVGVGNVQFTDTIDTYFFIGGVLTWEEPADTSGITEYRVRLVFDVAASREQLVYEPDLGFATAVPVGTTRFKILDDTARRFACCDPSNYPAAWLIVYIVKGSIQQEAMYAGHALIRDNQTTHVADSIYVQELQIVDTTPVEQINITLTGELYWNTSGPEYPNVGEDWSLIDQWDIYLAQGSTLASSERYVASVPLGTKSYIFTAQPLNQGDDTIIVYASNAVGKAPFGSVVQFGQFGGLQTTSTTTYSSTSTKPLTSMSGLTVTFTDTDTNAGALLGTITWDPPADPSALTSYDIYMSSDQQGSNQQILGLVPSNTNSYTISSPATRTTGTAFPANWLLVYPSIGGTISTYIDAASLPLYDNSGAVPDQPSFATVTFTDEDAAGNFASGTVRWTLASNTDFGHITHYAVYLAEDQAGLNKVAFGDPVTWDVTEVVVGTGIELSSRYHVVIYAVNTYGESLQPGNIASSGGTSIIFGDLGQSTTTTVSTTATTATSSSTTGVTETSVTTTSITSTSTSLTLTSSSITSITVSTTSSTTKSSTTSRTFSTTTSVTTMTSSTSSSTATTVTVTTSTATSTSKTETISTTVTSSSTSSTQSSTSTTSHTATSTTSVSVTSSTSTTVPLSVQILDAAQAAAEQAASEGKSPAEQAALAGEAARAAAADLNLPIPEQAAMAGLGASAAARSAGMNATAEADAAGRAAGGVGAFYNLTLQDQAGFAGKAAGVAAASAAAEAGATASEQAAAAGTAAADAVNTFSGTLFQCLAVPDVSPH
eukprot:s845_g3.t3